MGLVGSFGFGLGVVFFTLTVIMVSNVATSYIIPGGETISEWLTAKVVAPGREMV